MHIRAHTFPPHLRHLHGERDEREPNTVTSRISPPQHEGLAETEDSEELGGYGQPRNTATSCTSNEDLISQMCGPLSHCTQGRQAERAPLSYLCPRQPHPGLPGSKPEERYLLDQDPHPDRKRTGRVYPPASDNTEKGSTLSETLVRGCHCKSPLHTSKQTGS